MKTIDTLKAEALQNGWDAVFNSSKPAPFNQFRDGVNAYLSYLAEHKAEIVEVMCAAYGNPAYLSDGIRDALTASKLLEPVV